MGRSETLSDKAYHQIFESLFRISKLESSNYAKSSKAPAKTQAASRLSACAGALRVAVDASIRKIRSKTVKALVDHIMQTLPTADDGYCSPLLLDYFKVLRTVLEYQPHPEHLPKDAWNELADFCMGVVRDLNRLLSDSHPSLSFRTRHSDSFEEDRSRSVTPNIRAESTRKSSQSATQHSVSVSLKASTEDVVLCLKYLCSVSNAPISGKAHESLGTMLEFLRLSSNVGHAQQAAFDCIASVMSCITTEDTKLSLETLKSLIPLVCRFWQAKSQSLKDSMLITLLHGEPYFRRLALSQQLPEHRTEMKNLLDVMRDDYCKRSDRDRLLLDDLDLSQASVYSSTQAPLSTKAYRARLGLLKAEQPWAILQLSSSMVEALDLDVFGQGNRAVREGTGHTLKRRKVASAYGEVIQQARTTQALEKLYAVQLLAFILERPNCTTDVLQEALNALLSCQTNSDESIAVWSMLALAR